MGKIVIIIGLLIAVSGGTAFAMGQEGCGGDCTTCHSLTNTEASTLLKDIGTVKSVSMSRVRGLYELALEKDGKQGVVYLDYAKKHLISGQVFDIATRQLLAPVSAPPSPPAPPIIIDQGKIPRENSLIMGNPQGTRKLFVFTDPDCPFCGKMHGELQKLVAMEPDLAIYIKLFPLKMHPGAYDKARVILGKKSLELLEKSFNGQKLPPPGERDLAKPVDDSLKYAESIGINSTPTLVLPDGRVMAGYRDAAALRKLISGD